MPHIFLNTPSFNGNNDFFTESAILKTPYSPKVLIIGTYNDELNIKNPADFFYGRNYFWPVIYNLANNLGYDNFNKLKSPRLHSLKAGAPIPSLATILKLCIKFKLTFADLVQNVFEQLPNHDDKFIDQAIANGQAFVNIGPIIKYINDNPSIEYVYCTTKFGNLKNINNLWNLIQNGVRNNVIFGCIRTPSGRGGFSGPVSIGLSRYWLWCNHPENPHGLFQNSNGYSCFNHEWLSNSGVNVRLF
jgi:hypothetical protein